MAEAVFDLEKLKIGVIGVGVMGTTLIQGMLDAQLLLPHQIRGAVGRKSSQVKLSQSLPIEISIGYSDDWLSDTDVFLVCTKPNRLLDVLKPIAASPQLKPGALFISIAAGLRLQRLEAVLPNHPVIRAMPNTPCLVGAGVTVISPGNLAKMAHIKLATRFFSAVGQCFELEERHMDAVTAVSGSGPAYVYLIMEALADGAVKVGLPRNLALQLVSQTLLGAALMLQKSDKHPATLKDEVTTPAGCTIHGLLVLEDGGIRSTLARAVEAATKTASELGK